MKTVNIQCPVGKTGYGITSLNIIKELNKIPDLQISLFPIGNNIELNSENEKVAIQKLLENSDTFDYLAPSLKIWHQFDLASRIGSGRYFSFPFFEIDKISTKEQTHLNSCNGIFVASSWAKQILIQNGVTKPIIVSPLAVDTEIFKVPIKIRIENPNYVFFHIGKWEHRKGQDFLLKCFENAFTETDKVELYLVPHNPFLNKDEESWWHNQVANNKLKDKIKVFDRLPTQYHLADFIFHCDCGVFLSRAEGWNNEILECMAINKPIITTNYSAHTEYCDNNNCYLVDVLSTEPANDGKWFHGNGNWAKLAENEMDQTINYMRHVYNNNIKTNPSGLETCKKYTWSNTTNIIYQHIFNKDHANSKKRKRRR